MSVLELELDESLLSLLRQSNQPVDRAAREMITLEFYRRGLISSGKAAGILGMDRFDFVRHAGRLGIPLFEMTEDEWAAEVEQVESIVQQAKSTGGGNGGQSDSFKCEPADRPPADRAP